MSEYLIKNAVIADPSSPENGKKIDISISHGKIILAAGHQLSDEVKIFDAGGAYISPGWVDLRANFCDPGHEYREDLISGTEAAAYGGFTTVALLPETDPRLVSKGQVEYLNQFSRKSIVDILPLAAISSSSDKLQLSEMHDLKKAGVAGFSSGYTAIGNKGYLLRVLQYAGDIGLPIMLRAENKELAGKGVMHEGNISVALGMNGIPAIAEETEIYTLLELCRYTLTPLHFSCISTARGMDMVINAQKEGLPVTASVSVHHLSFTDEDLAGFDTNFKLRPPLRAKEDQEFLRKAVKEHDFIAVVSDHTPIEEDGKKCEFELAAYGATGLQTMFPQLAGWLSVPQIVEAIAIRPRKILGSAEASIKDGAVANFTIFDPEEYWQLDKFTNKSKSRNSPVWAREHKGRAKAIFNKGWLKILN